MVAPIDVPSIVPPVIATEEAFWVDIVPRPVMSVFGIVDEAVKALVPLPFTYPVRVVAPVPPCETVTVPDVIWLALMAMVAFAAAVSWPCALTVKVGTTEAEP